MVEDLHKIQLFDGKSHAVVGGENILILDIDTGEVVRKIECLRPMNFTILKKGLQIAALSGRAVVIYDVTSGKRVARIKDTCTRDRYELEDYISGMYIVLMAYI